MIAAHHSMLRKAGGAFIVPTGYIEFNVNNVSRQSRYFDSGVVPTANTKVEIMHVRHSNAPNATRGIQSGCRTGWVSGAMQLNVYPANTHFWFAWNNATNNVEDAEYQDPPEFAVASFNPGGLVSVVGINPAVSYTYNFGQNFSSSRSNTFFIGDSNENGTAKGRTDSQGCGRIAWVKFYESGALIHNFVASTYNNKPSFYDEVTGNYLQSAGNAAESSLRYVALAWGGV